MNNIALGAPSCAAHGGCLKTPKQIALPPQSAVHITQLNDIDAIVMRDCGNVRSPGA
jgi:hypothetical protein